MASALLVTSDYNQTSIIINFQKSKRMKKTFLSMLMIASCFGVTNAQIVTDNNNNVGIHVPSGSSMKSYFSVNSLGTSEATSYILTNSDLQSII